MFNCSVNETQLFQNLSPSFDPICRSNCAIYVHWSLFRNFLPHRLFLPLRVWNYPSTIYLVSCFPTTIYDVMKRIRPTSESFLSFSPTSWPSSSLSLPFFNLSIFLLLFLAYLYFSTSHFRYPLTFAIYSVLFFFSSIDFSDFSQTKWTVSNLAIPRGFIYSCPSFTSLSITIRWRFTTSVRTKLFEKYQCHLYSFSHLDRFLFIIF